MIKNKKIKVLKTANSVFTIAAMFVYIIMPILTLAPQTANAVTISNPSLPPGGSCGLDIALVLDNSTSITTSQRTQMKSALTAFTSALSGTPTHFSVTRFGTTASVLQPFTGDISLVNTAINSLPANPPSSNYTNWEDGLIKAASTLPHRSNPNLVIFATDGDPTASSAGSNNTNQPNLHLTPAVTQADSIKAGGTRILVIGLAFSAGQSSRLQAISGSNINTGDVLTSDVITTGFETLAAELAEFARQTCGGTITVTKIVGQTPTNGWTFMIGDETHITGELGGGIGQTQAVDLTNGIYDVIETPQAGYTLNSASCVITNNGNAPVGTPDIQNYQVKDIQISTDNIISCVFNNSLICTDIDQDGYCAEGGQDCNDADPSIYPGATEMCNGVDDNCNQVIDEGFNVGVSCSAGLGICQASGQFVCTINGLDTECNAVAGTPSEEICDGQLDEDCDGTVDEDCDCTNGAERPCGDTPNQGICMQGTQTCDGGAWGECIGAVYSDEEICGNQIDEDCDGSDLACPLFVTINAYKVVCQTETDLPNWGNGGPDITSATADDYVGNCWLEAGWNFEWAYAGTSNPGNNIIGPAGSPWTTFGPTDGNGESVTTINSLSGDRIWVREVMKAGYIPFSGDTTAPYDDVSAELYCHQDVLNYDNYDYILNPELDHTYYCVAFNAPVEQPQETGSITACKYYDTNKDGEYDSGTDTPLAWNITVWYYPDPAGPGGVIHSTATNPTTGCVTFNDLLYGTYTVHEEHISDWVQTAPHPDGSPTIIISGTNVNPTVTFLNYETPTPGSISGIKFNDLEGDVFGPNEGDTGDPGLEGWTIELYRQSEGWQLITSVQTAADGSFHFTNLEPGVNYKVAEVMQNGWTPLMPNGQGYYTVSPLQPGSNITKMDFGNHQISPSPTPTPTPTPEPSCGDGYCNGLENCTTCVNDCGICIAIGGGGGAGGSSETLLIYDEVVSGVGDTSATITWKTKISLTDFPYAASSQVIYGASTEAHTLNLSDNMGVPPLYGYAHTTAETDTAPKVTDHSVTITGLTPGTTYFFRCVSRGSFAVSTELSLTTTGVAGVTTGQATPTPGAGAPSETPGEEIPPEGIGGIGTPEATPVISPEVAGAAAVGGFALGNLCWLLLAAIIILLILYLLSVLSKKRGENKKGWILPLATAVLIILYCIFCCSSCGSIFCCKICWVLIAALIAITLIPLLFEKKQ